MRRMTKKKKKKNQKDQTSVRQSVRRYHILIDPYHFIFIQHSAPNQHSVLFVTCFIVIILSHVVVITAFHWCTALSSRCL